MRGDLEQELRSFYRRNPEVERLVKRRRRIFFLKLALLEGVVAFVTQEIVRYGLPIHAAVVGVIAAVVLPLLVLHPRRWVGKGYVGRITMVKHAQRREVTMEKKGPGRAYQALVCTVITEKGKKRRFTVRALYGRVYYKDARVLYIPALPLPIPLAPKEFSICPFCSSRIHLKNDHCVDCGASPMDV